MDTCKKRWKYLRERYVQQKKVGDSPSYEHLSRPYLEKMKFLDNFIQPRKSYRHVGLFTSPSISMNMFDGNESSKSSSSIQMTSANHLSNLSEDAYAQLYHLNQFTQGNLVVKSEDTSERNSTDLTNTKHDLHHNNMPSSSSSVISQESPATILSNSTTNETDEPTEPTIKRRRTNSIIDNNNLHIEQLHRLHENHQKQILNHNHLSDNDEQSSINNDDRSDHQSPTVPTDFLYPFYQNSSSRARKSSEHLESQGSTFPNPADFLHPFYQQARQTRNSEQLLGELVTSELIKMTKDKKKIVQKKILEILFFDDD